MRETLLVASDQTFRTYDATTVALIAQSQEPFKYGAGGVLVRGLYYSPHPTKPLIRCTRLDKPHEAFSRLVLPDVAVAFDVSESASWLVVAFRGGRVMSWDLHSGFIMKSFSISLDVAGEIKAVRISPQEHAVVIVAGHTCLMYSMTNFVHLVDVSNESREAPVAELAKFRCFDPIAVMDLCFRTDSYDPTICLGDEKGRVYCWQPHLSTEASWICDLHAPITAIAMMETLEHVLVASTHPEIFIAEFDIFYCACKATEGPLIWEQHATNWSRDSLPELRSSNTSSAQGGLPLVKQLKMSKLERMVATVTSGAVVVWDYEKRAVHRVIHQDGAVDVAFALVPPTLTSIAEQTEPVGVPPTSPSAPRVPLQTTMMAEAPGTLIFHDDHTKSNLHLWLNRFYARRPCDLLDLTTEHLDVIENYLVCVADREKQEQLLREHERKLERAEHCYEQLKSHVQATARQCSDRCVHEGKSCVLFNSVNPRIGTAPITRTDQQPKADVPYFIPPETWQSVSMETTPRQ